MHGAMNSHHIFVQGYRLSYFVVVCEKVRSYTTRVFTYFNAVTGKQHFMFKFV